MVQALSRLVPQMRLLMAPQIQKVSSDLMELNRALVSNNEVVVVEILLTIRGLALMLDLMNVLTRHFTYSK